MDKVPKDIRNLITDYYGQRKQFYELYDNDYINRNHIINCFIGHSRTIIEENGTRIKKYRIYMIMSNGTGSTSTRSYPGDGTPYLTYEEAKKKQQEILFG